MNGNFHLRLILSRRTPNDLSLTDTTWSTLRSAIVTGIYTMFSFWLAVASRKLAKSWAILQFDFAPCYYCNIRFQNDIL
jgi:hypothetical protein